MSAIAPVCALGSPKDKARGPALRGKCHPSPDRSRWCFETLLPHCLYFRQITTSAVFYQGSKFTPLCSNL